MTILGAVLAGGQASRFGADKALALLHGRTLLDHALATLTPHVDALVVVGRVTAPVATTPDRPRAGLGPLGGIAGALSFAKRNGHEAVLTIACDTPALPGGMIYALFAPRAGIAAEAPTIGLWRVNTLPALIAHLESGEDRSIRRWARALGMTEVMPGVVVRDANTPEALAALAAN